MPLKEQSTKNSKSNLTEEDFDFNFKFLMLGNQAVGKTCFLVRYTNHSFTVGTRCSVGIDVAFKSVVRNDKKIKLRIMDTGKVFLSFCCHFTLLLLSILHDNMPEFITENNLIPPN